jgi:hypothetical protein
MVFLNYLNISQSLSKIVQGGALSGHTATRTMLVKGI